MMAFRLVNGQDPPDADYVLDALLRHNYLPMQKKRREELPPIFSSMTFTPEVARKLAHTRARSGALGYDAVEYRVTRFTGISRPLSIPHPMPYAQLCLCLYENWHHLQGTTDSDVSRVRPQRHSDGRLVMMDYEMHIDEDCRSRELSFGKQYVVRTDIANFFPSIYSHAVPWAAVGFVEAKARRFENTWFNNLDKRLRCCKREETQGVAIGPATSSIVSELVLDCVDRVMHSRNYVFERFVDDYSAYCTTENEAREFVRELSEELAKYKLTLNAKKTQVRALPHAFAPTWTSQLANSCPTGQPVSRYQAIDYLNMAVSLAKEEPDESVLKFAFKALARQNLDSEAQRDTLPYLLELSFHQPGLLPLAGHLLASMPPNASAQYAQKFVSLAQENAKYRRSDGMCWALYYLNKYAIPIDTATAENVASSEDCLSLLLLYLSGTKNNQDLVHDFVGKIGKDRYDLDRYWILLYQLFRDGEIENPYPDEDAFPFLKDHNVTFVDETATIEDAPEETSVL